MAVYLVWLLLLFFGGVLTALGLVPWPIGLVVSGLGIALTLPWTVSVPARWALTILNAATGKLRSVGSGRHFVWRPVESPDRFGEVRVFVYNFTVDAEAGNKDVVPLKVHLEYKTSSELLHRWFIIGEEGAVSKLLEERAKSKITERVFDFGNRELVYDYIDQLSRRIRKDLEEMVAEGMSVPDYCGVEILDFRISDIDLPQAIRDAEVEKELAREKRLAKAEDWASVEERAATMIAEGVDPENAYKTIQVQDKLVEDKIHRFEVGRNLSGLARDAGKGIGDGLTAAAGLLGQLIKPAAPTVPPAVPAAVAPKPPVQPRVPRPKPPFKAVVEVNDPSLAQQIVSGQKKVELEVKDGKAGTGSGSAGSVSTGSGS